MELKSCPFCKSDNDQTVRYAASLFWVYCNECHADGPPARTREEAAEAWNRRSAAASEWMPISEKPESGISGVLFMCKEKRCYCLGGFAWEKGGVLVGVSSCTYCSDHSGITLWAEINLPEVK